METSQDDYIQSGQTPNLESKHLRDGDTSGAHLTGCLFSGCFRDTGTTRDLSVFSPNNQGRMTTATVEVCRSICKSKGD